MKERQIEDALPNRALFTCLRIRICGEPGVNKTKDKRKKTKVKKLRG
jgi:hypothetical protein